MNRKGAWDTVVIVAITLALLAFLLYIFYGDILSPKVPGAGTIWDKVQQTQSFETLWNERAGFFDYIFGGVPQYLIDLTSSEAAPIIMIGVWLLLFLGFGDILSVFGFFSKYVAWLSAGILTLIAANLKIISLITIALLTITSFLGALSVIVSIAGVFVIFLLFHFGSNKLRQYMIIRRSQDVAIRAVAGGKKAASGIAVLKEIVAEAEKGEK